MMMVATDTVGGRIRYWRLRRGKSQAVLGGLAGVSQAYISQVEAGRRSIDRRSTLVAVASALRVTVADLLGQPGDPTDPNLAGAADAVPSIWAALIEIEEGERRQPVRTREQLAADIERADELRASADCGVLAGSLPSLLYDAAAYGGLPLARVGYQTSSCLRSLGYRHLALPAARIAHAAAQDADDAAWIGAARFAYTLALPIEAAGLSSRTADRTLAELQGRTTSPAVRQMLGQLHLSAAFTATVDGQQGRAADHLAEAAGEADTLGDPGPDGGFNRNCFGPTNVGLWKMSVAAEQGEYGRVIELGRGIRPDGLPHANRHQSYWMALGRALADSGRTDREALVAFVRAERAAPALFTLNPLARDAIVAMVHRARRRSTSEDLRILARRIGVEIAP